MARMGKKQLTVQLSKPIKALPASLTSDALVLSPDGDKLIYSYDTRAERTGITKLLSDVSAAGLTLTDIETSQSSLEDIFVDLVKEDAA
jgi:ABC-2 type transport system ATP-binding protein